MEQMNLYMMQMKMANPMLFQNSLFTNNLQQVFKNNININLINSNSFNMTPNPMQFNMFSPVNMCRMPILQTQQPNMNQTFSQQQPQPKPKPSHQNTNQTKQSDDKKDQTNTLSYIYGGQVIIK